MDMKRFTMLLLSVTTAVALAGVTSAQSTDPGANAGSNAQPNAQSKPEPSTPPASIQPVPATPEVSPQTTEAGVGANAVAKAKPNPVLDAVRAKARQTSPKELESVNKEISANQNEVEAEATAKGDATVAGRIAAEFGMTSDALVAERAQFGRGWGELMIAHTLAANSKTGLTVADVLQLRTDGLGWGQIAHGMDFKLGDVTSAVKAEAKVATGLTKADGKVAMIHGVKAGAGVGAEASVKGGRVKDAGTPASVGVGVGAGTKLEKGQAGNK
jgi:hypothetical protein